MDMRAKIEGVEGRIQYQFRTSVFIWEALQAPGSSVHVIDDRRIIDGNKRLGVFGDTVLQLAICDDWLGGNESKGRYDQIRQEVASNVNLDRVGRLHRLDQYVNKNPAQRGAVPPGLMAATVEAILGAVFQDGGLQNLKEVMVTLGLVPT